MFLPLADTRLKGNQRILKLSLAMKRRMVYRPLDEHKEQESP